MKLTERVAVRLTKEQVEFLGTPLSDNLRATIDFVIQLNNQTNEHTNR